MAVVNFDLFFQAQHVLAARAALKAAMKMAHEAQNAAKEAEVLAAARQYHAAHVSSKYWQPCCLTKNLNNQQRCFTFRYKY